ncbi:tetratricopeptide repeat protein [Dokdonella sp.]|uniref:tetratricopeptide repeat protein n=1 Tax=Dokdonella sp. TaxID=2291710 RepID=UPI001B172884|nr:tetratricopeptide repeat protein [Dokdonella sp.]MBO9664922.1 tetratricopeptide repeat protein [Dokdonella sp.]
MNAGGDDAAARRWARVGEILDRALGASGAERERIVEECCAGDADLRAEVESLLGAEAVADAKLENRVLEWAGDLAGEEIPGVAAEHVTGDLIGGWRLGGEIGRGGMGTVWRAERADGVFEERAALKLIRRGLDSDAILGRFLAERRILARLQHPNIAHLVDGGMTEDGRPYFAMELVEGEPITTWADARKLSVRTRVRLLLGAIDAVQHAHQRLVIHRDLKPSNILVTTTGDVKLLDFGIAKLLDAETAGAESASLTQLGLRMLTPEYAAPEQLRGESATTATDVYALGVLLYELLVGERPTAARHQQGPPADGSVRPVPRPSTRVGEQAAHDRGSSRDRLRRALRGDLDTITLRALHEEPERRYRTAEALGDDLRRYLNGRPVRARPDSVGYRVHKFVVRNRLATAAAVLATLSLGGGLFATAWQARRAEQRADEARLQAQRAEEVKGFLVRIFEAGGTREWRKEPTARELLDAGARRVDEELAANPALRAEMQAVIGELYLDQGRLDAAEPLLRSALEQRRRSPGEGSAEYADSLYQWSVLLHEKGDWREAQAAQTRVLSLLRGGAAADRSADRPDDLPDDLPDDRRVAKALGGLSASTWALGDADEAIRLRREAIAIARRASGADDGAVADDLRLLASMLAERQQYAEAEPLFEEALAIYRRVHGARSVRYALGLNDQAVARQSRGEIERAATAYLEAADIYRQAGDPIDREESIHRYGKALCTLGRFDEAEKRLRESLELVKRDHVAADRVTMRTLDLGACLLEAGRHAEADALLRAGLDGLPRNGESDTSWAASAACKYADSLLEQGRLDEAKPWFERALRSSGRLLGADDASGADCLRGLARVNFAAGAREEGLAQTRQALQVLRRTRGPTHPAAAAAAVDLAALELRAGNAEDAEALLREAEPAFESSGDRPHLVMVRMLRGAALSRLGRADAAQPLLREAFAARRGLYGERNVRTAEAEIHLGRCLIENGEKKEGRRLLEHGRSILRQRMRGHEALDIANAALART